MGNEDLIKDLFTAQVADVKTIEKDILLKEVNNFAERKMRFVTATCLDKEDKFHIYYHFDENLEMTSLKVVINKDDVVPSISGIYGCAILVENEIQEFFGVKFEGLSLDFKGTLFLETGTFTTPMLKSVNI
jgi:ech hydrogenase subunit D